MIKYQLLAFFWSLALISASQVPQRPNLYDQDSVRNGDWILFYDSLGEEVAGEDSWIHYCLMDVNRGKPRGKVNCFYPTGVKSFSGYIIQLDPVVKHGRFSRYHENSALAEKGTYLYDSLHGLYEGYHPNGVLNGAGEWINNKEQGQWDYFYDNGQSNYSVHFNSGKKYGPVKIYLEDGSLNSEGVFKENIAEGYWKTYFSSGILANEGGFENDLRIGEWNWYHDNGTLKENEFYKDNLNHGPYASYYANRQQEVKGEYIEGKKEGDFNYWYDNGQPQAVGAFRESLKYGAWTYFHENGSKESEGNIVNDQYEGPWKFYFESGEKSAEISYHNDLAEGEALYYYSNGATKATGKYVSDVKDGEWKYYHDNGQVAGIESYAGGVLEGYKKLFYSNGQLQEKGLNQKGQAHGLWENFRNDGSQISSKNYEAGNLQGWTITFFDNGRKNSHGTYKDGKRDSVWTYYHNNGEVFASGTYREGNSTGVWKYYHENGQLKSKGSEYADLKNGQWKFYDRKGNITFEGFYEHNKAHGKFTYYDSLGDVKKETQFHQDVEQNFTSYYDSINSLSQKRKFEEAALTLEKAKADWTKEFAEKDLRKSDLYEIEGILELRKGNEAKSERLFNKALKNANKYKQDTSIWYTSYLSKLAGVYLKRQDYSKAIATYRKSLDLTAQRPGGKEEGRYTSDLLELAFGMRNTGRDQEAVNLLLEDLASRPETPGQAKNISRMYFGIADALMSAELPGADSVVQVAIKHVRKNQLESFWTYPPFLYYRARILHDQGDLDLAKTQYQNVLSAFSAQKDTIDDQYIYTLSRLGNIHYGRAEYDSSRYYYHKAYRIVSSFQMQDSWAYPSIIDDMSDQYWIEDNYDSVVVFSKHLLEISLKEDNHYRASAAANGLALAYAEKGEAFYNQALKYHKRAVELVRKEDVNQYIHARVSLANFHRFYLKDPKRAKLINDESLLFTRAKDNSAQALKFVNIYNEVAWNRYNLYEYDSARYYANKSVKLLEADPSVNFTKYLDALNLLATIDSDVNNFSSARSYNLRAYEAANQQFGLESSYTASYAFNLAIALELDSDFTSAIYYLDQALASSKTIGRTDLTARYETVKAENLMYLKEYDKARRPLESARAFYFEELEKSRNYLTFLLELGYFYEKTDQLDSAEWCYSTIEKEAPKIEGEHPLYPNRLRDLSQAFQRLHQYERALEFNREALSVASGISGNQSLQYAWQAEPLGEILVDLDEYAEGLNYLNQAKEIYLKTLGEGPEFIKVLNKLRRAYLQVGRNEEARGTLGTLEEVILTTKGRYSEAYIDFLESKAYTYLRIDKPSRAMATLDAYKSLHDSLGLERRKYIQYHNYRGWAYYDLDSIHNAITQYKSAINLADSLFGENSENAQVIAGNMALAHMELGQLQAAEEIWLSNKMIGQLTEMERVSWYSRLARLYTHWGKLSKAKTYWDQVNETLLGEIKTSFTLLSETGKAAFWDEYKEDFETFNTYAIKAHLGNDPKALQQMYDNQLQTKSILMSTTTRERRRILNTKDKTLARLYREYLATKEALSKRYGKITSGGEVDEEGLKQLESRVEGLERSLSISSEQEKRTSAIKGVSWKNVQKSLDEDEAAIEIVRFRYYHPAKDDSVVYAALILTSKSVAGPQLVLIPNGASLEKKYVKAYRNSMKLKIGDKRSYGFFWKTIDEALPSDIQKIFLSSDGVYHQVNIATLQRPDGSYVSESYQIAILSSTRDLPVLSKRAKRRSEKTAYIFGNPKFDLDHEQIEMNTGKRGLNRTTNLSRAVTLENMDFAELPGTKKETETIASVLDKSEWNVNLYLGQNALEDELKQVDNPSILHIATHGFFLEETKRRGSALASQNKEPTKSVNPLLRSGLVLAGATQTTQGQGSENIENGIFTAYEAMNLDLSATDLVVLSACETGLGEIKNGEGVYGLQRAFQIAGAKSILMSLWKVNDDATQLLMTSFYEAWLRGASESSALESAQQTVKEIYPHPYYWGSFVLVSR